MDVTIRLANLDEPQEAEQLVALIDSYARGPEGQSAPLDDDAKTRIASGLREHPKAFVLLALLQSRVVGAAVCFECFSTFAGKPLVNIHDLAVLPDFRGSGIGSQLLAAVEQQAKVQGCCKVTLEVHHTNLRAKRLYERVGFGPWDPGTAFVSKVV